MPLTNFRPSRQPLPADPSAQAADLARRAAALEGARKRRRLGRAKHLIDGQVGNGKSAGATQPAVLSKAIARLARSTGPKL